MEKSGTMRSSSRSPPILLAALLVAVGFLGYKYWSVSAKHGTVSAQLEALQLEFRAVSDKHLIVEKRAAELSTELEEAHKKLTHLETDNTEKDNQITQLSGETSSLKDQLQKSQDSVEGANQQKDAALQEKNGIAEELGQVKAKLTELQSAPKVCDKEACKEPIREVIGAMTKSVGKTAVAGALKQQNVEVMQIAGDLLEGGEPAGQNQPAGGQGDHRKADAGGQEQKN